MAPQYRLRAAVARGRGRGVEVTLGDHAAGAVVAQAVGGLVSPGRRSAVAGRIGHARLHGRVGPRVVHLRADKPVAKVQFRHAPGAVKGPLGDRRRRSRRVVDDLVAAVQFIVIIPDFTRVGVGPFGYRQRLEGRTCYVPRIADDVWTSSTRRLSES